MQERNIIKKFKYVVSLRAVKIAGLILLVATQAIPLGAFEGHIVSVTAIIDPPHSSLTSDSGQAHQLLSIKSQSLEDNASTTADVEASSTTPVVLGVADFATSTDPTIDASSSDPTNGTGGTPDLTVATSSDATSTVQADSSSGSTDANLSDATTTPEPTITAQPDNPAPSTAADASLAGDSSGGQPDATITKLEITSADSSLVIENSGAFAQGSSE
jgi:hypothetical protein